MTCSRFFNEIRPVTLCYTLLSGTEMSAESIHASITPTGWHLRHIPEW